MLEYGEDESGVESISQAGDKGEEEEECEVEDEEDIGDDLEPVAVVG